MTSLTFFYQACPVCGRSLRVPVQYFGKAMSCSHCGGEFLAVDAGTHSVAPPKNEPPLSDGRGRATVGTALAATSSS